jgi:hypothetical protein
MTKQTFIQKTTGDTLSASDWNGLTGYVNEVVDEVNGGGSHVSFDSEGKHNLNVVTTAEDQYMDGDKVKGGKINIEPISDLQVKPGDDITLYSHHRSNQEELSVKVLNGAEVSATDNNANLYAIIYKLLNLLSYHYTCSFVKSKPLVT